MCTEKPAEDNDSGEEDSDEEETDQSEHIQEPTKVNAKSFLSLMFLSMWENS